MRFFDVLNIIIVFERPLKPKYCIVSHSHDKKLTHLDNFMIVLYDSISWLEVIQKQSEEDINLTKVLVGRNVYLLFV